MLIKFFLLALFTLTLSTVSTSSQDMPDDAKPRILIMTDIGANDTDDEQSLVRFLVYANEFDVEGLIASSNVNETGDETHPQMMREIIGLYGEVYDNLILHDPDYPTAEYLLSIVRDGQPNASGAHDVFDSIGADKDTEASNHIIEVVDRDDPRPINITAWGGTADLAQALWRVREDRTPEELAEFISKIRVHAIADQDSTGPWIRESFPDLFYILNLAPDGQNKFTSVFRGMYREGDASLVSREWVTNNVIESHGPLGARYPLDGAGVEGLKEGDTPSWFYFLDNGLQNPAMPSWGGWGGRFELRPGGTYYQDTEDTLDTTNRIVTVYRWRPAYQNDFEARMDWNILPYDEANHNPIVTVDQEAELSVASGSVVNIDAAQSTDPDGDNLSFNWYYYPEPSTFTEAFSLPETTSSILNFTAPSVTEPQTLHIILSVTDDGSPALTSYQRFVITVEAPSEQTYDVVPETATQGIEAQYFSGMDFNELVTTQTDVFIDFVWHDDTPSPAMEIDKFSVRWSGWIVPEHSEEYTFYTTADDGVRLYLDGRLLIEDWAHGGARENSNTILLEAGVPYPFIVEYYEAGSAARVNLQWSSPSVEKEVIGPEHFYIIEDAVEDTITTATDEELIQILPLGDSITQADKHTNSYRRPLWFLLQEANYNVDFIGSTSTHHQGDAPTPDFDLDHEGHWGWRTDEIYSELPTWLESYTPDVVLLHLGTNDIFQGTSVDNTLDNLTQIVDALRADNPNVTILAAQVIPHTRGDRPSLEAFNDALPTWVDTVTTAESPVILVDQASSIDPEAHLYDGVHPNKHGEEVMASVWFSVLEDVIR